MNLNNACGECGKKYDKIPVRCMCGWYFTKHEPVKNDPSRCQMFKDGEQCPELGTTTFRTKGNDWYCGMHARELREASFIR